jgi:hypothetical protein
MVALSGLRSARKGANKPTDAALPHLLGVAADLSLPEASFGA